MTRKRIAFYSRVMRRHKAATLAAAMVGAALGASLGAPAQPAPIVHVTKVAWQRGEPLPFERLPPLHFYRPVPHVPETVGGFALDGSDYADAKQQRRRERARQ